MTILREVLSLGAEIKGQLQNVLHNWHFQTFYIPR